MKKRILFAVTFIAIFTALFSLMAFASTRRTEIPVTMTINSRYYGGEATSFQITKCDINWVENLYGKYRNRIHLDMEVQQISGSSHYIDVICYDSKGNYISTEPYTEGLDYIDVPDLTAMIEFVPGKAYDSKYIKPEFSETYFYCKYTNVYAGDGSIMAICDLQTPVYELVGWKAPVTLYSLDGRWIDVSPYEVEAYKCVGWYTWEDSVFNKLQLFCSEYQAKFDYFSMISDVNLLLPYLTGTQYESELYNMRTNAMDLWRNAANCPLGVGESEIGEYDGSPNVTIAFCNVSYKKIRAFKVTFDCFDVFWNPEETGYKYYDDDANIEPGDTYYTSWSIYTADSIAWLSDIKVVEVVFADGSTWKAN